MKESHTTFDWVIKAYNSYFFAVNTNIKAWLYFRQVECALLWFSIRFSENEELSKMFKKSANACRIVWVSVECMNNGALSPESQMHGIGWCLLSLEKMYDVNSFPPPSNVQILGVPQATFQGFCSNLWNLLVMSQLINRPLQPRCVLSSQESKPL